MDGRLLRIMADLVGEPERWREFNEDPKAFVAAYGLTHEETVLVYTCSRELVGEGIRRELGHWHVMDRARWPGPRPCLKGIEETKQPGAGRTRLTVVGCGILDSPALRVFLVPRGGSAADGVPGEVHGVDGPFRETRLRVSFATEGLLPGTYDILVFNDEDVLYLDRRDPWPEQDAQNPGIPPLVLPRALTITAPATEAARATTERMETTEAAEASEATEAAETAETAEATEAAGSREAGQE